MSLGETAHMQCSNAHDTYTVVKTDSRVLLLRKGQAILLG